MSRTGRDAAGGRAPGRGRRPPPSREEIDAETEAAEAAINRRTPLSSSWRFSDHPVFRGVARGVLTTRRPARACLRALLPTARRSRELFRWTALTPRELADGFAAAAALRHGDFPSLRRNSASQRAVVAGAIALIVLYLAVVLADAILGVAATLRLLAGVGLARAASIAGVHVVALAAAVLIPRTGFLRARRRLLAADACYAEAFGYLRAQRGILDGVPKALWPAARPGARLAGVITLIATLGVIVLAALLLFLLFQPLGEDATWSLLTTWLLCLFCYGAWFVAVTDGAAAARSPVSARARLEKLILLVREAGEGAIDRE